MGHHHHSHSGNKKALFISFLIITGYMVIEAAGGLLTNSLALLSDAGHMLSDSISLGIGLLAFIIGEKKANDNKTYGYKRLEILAALFNGITLMVISLFIIYHAVLRFLNPPEIASEGMLVIALIGLIVNIIVAWIMMKTGDTHGNLNMKAAFLHVIGDMLGSVGAILAALLIMFFGWGWSDPLASVIVALIILNGGWRVTMDAFHILMEGTPKNIQIEDVIRTVHSVPGVISIHDVHLWSISSGSHVFSCHVVVDENLTVKCSHEIIQEIKQRLAKKNIRHITIQIENHGMCSNDSIFCNDIHHHYAEHEH